MITNVKGNVSAVCRCKATLEPLFVRFCPYCVCCLFRLVKWNSLPFLYFTQCISRYSFFIPSSLSYLLVFDIYSLFLFFLLLAFLFFCFDLDAKTISVFFCFNQIETLQRFAIKLVDNSTINLSNH